MSSADPRRLIALEAVHNFRDLGGYRTVDGQTLRYGTLFRADGLQRLTAADVETLRPLGLRTVIDLRTDREIAERGTFPHDAYPVHWYHLPVIDVTWAPDASNDMEPTDFLYEQYRSMLDYGEPRFVEAFRLLGVPGAFPAVFHCAAGKDRTGIMAALILGALGVPDDVIVADYALTRPAMERMRAWAAVHSPEMFETWRKMPAAFGAAEPQAMAWLLADLRSRFGTITAYLRGLGVPRAALDALAAELLATADRRAA
jgi:protein-tyrosine phosphatase